MQAVIISFALRKEVESHVIPVITVDNCPECKSKEIVKHGVRHNKSSNIQRYSCKQCGFWFTHNLGFERCLFCKPGVKIVATCQIYDSSLPNAHLVGIEYIISAKDYNSLPTEDKPNWYIIDKKLGTVVQGQFPELNAQQINAVLQHLLGNYGKVILGIH
jgi:rubredoxin